MHIIGQLKALPRAEVDALLRRFNVNRVRELRLADVEAFTGRSSSSKVEPRSATKSIRSHEVSQGVSTRAGGRGCCAPP